MLRTMVAGLAIASVGLVGCSKQSEEPAAAPESSSVSDEQQIRDVTDQMLLATASYDRSAMAALTCSKNREEVASKPTKAPQVAEIGTPAENAALDRATVAAKFQRDYPKASETAVNAAADALLASDQTAMDKAFQQIYADSTTMTLDRIENIAVDGDTATADVTVVNQVGDDAPKTFSNKATYVREDGKWLDCSD